MKTKVLYFLIICSINILLGNELTFKEQNFFIKNGYISRSAYTHFDDSCLKDEFQNEVYFAAYELSKINNCKKIYDIGCGSGYKLLKYFSIYETIGYEIQPTLDFLIRTYPYRNWKLSDFNQNPELPDSDIIICADVIEHLVNPDALLNWIAKFDFKYLVISTPDRDLLTHLWTDYIYGPQSQSGPPVNIAHIREWSFQEFATYIIKYFDIVNHFHTEKEFWGQVIIAKKKQNIGR